VTARFWIVLSVFGEKADWNFVFPATTPSLTINVPLILKVREINFFSRAKHMMGHVKEFFESERDKERADDYTVQYF
jgi:hypothetical protein